VQIIQVIKGKHGRVDNSKNPGAEMQNQTFRIFSFPSKLFVMSARNYEWPSNTITVQKIKNQELTRAM